MNPPAIAAAPPQEPVRSSDQDVGAGAGRFDRRGGAGDTVAGDDDVGLVVPRGDRDGRDGRDVGVGCHSRIAAGISPTHWWPQ